jgi:hypothetical protein
MLDKVQQTLSGLAGPSSNWVGDLGLLAAEVLPEVGSWYSLLTKPKVLLRKTEGAVDLISPVRIVAWFWRNSLLQAWCLVAQGTAVNGLDRLGLDLLILLLLNWGYDIALSLGLLGLGYVANRGNKFVDVHRFDRSRRRVDGARRRDLGCLLGFDGRHVWVVWDCRGSVVGER